MYKLRKLTGFSKKDLAYLVLFLVDFLDQGGIMFAETPVITYV